MNPFPQPAQKATKAATKQLIGAFEDTFDVFRDNLNPLGQEAGRELFGFFGENGLSSRPQTGAKEELAYARKEKAMKKADSEDHAKSDSKAAEVMREIKQSYKEFQTQKNAEDKKVNQEIGQLEEEIVKLAKASGVDTKIHLQNNAQKGKSSLQTLKLLTQVVKTMRIQADKSKSASELVSQRNNAKRPTGMMAWVSGKQMKIHEQGTLQLQG